jgi:protein involved in polysaccharide export with SLBB domain
MADAQRAVLLRSVRARYDRRAHPPRSPPSALLGAVLTAATPEAPSLTSPGATPGTEPLAPEAGPPAARGEASSALRARPSANLPEGRQPARAPPSQLPSIGGAAAGGRPPAIIPAQEVGADGAISLPYAGRVPAAGRSPVEVQQTIEARLAEKALEPQALVIVTKTAANTVTVAGEASLAKEAAIAGEGGATVPLSPSCAAAPPETGPSSLGARIPLSPGGDRLLEVIAAARAAGSSERRQSQASRPAREASRSPTKLR